MLQIRRKARLVYKVTENLQTRMSGTLKEQMDKLEAAKTAVGSALEDLIPDAVEQREKLQKRLADVTRMRDEIAARLAQVEGLKIGDEVAEGSVEILTELTEGDLEDRLNDAQIVIEDGRIIEIRNP